MRHSTICGIRTTFSGAFILVCLAGALSGCSSDSKSSTPAAAADTDSTTPPPVTPDGTGTGSVTGQIVDGATRTPIGDAEVSLVINGVKQTTHSSTSSDPDLAGTFVFSGVPSGVHSLKIAAAGYAVWRRAVEVGPSLDGTPHTENLGRIGVGRAFTLTVVATTDGTPIEGVTVVAESHGMTNDCGFLQVWYTSPPVALLAPFTMDDQESTAVTNSSGQALFTGLNQCLTYMVVALPHDADGNGTYDHSAATAVYDGATNSSQTVALAINPAQRNDPIMVVGTSMDRVSRVQFTARNLTDTDLDPGSDLAVHGAGCVSSSTASCPSPYNPPGDFPLWGVPVTGTHSAFKLVFNNPVSASGTTVSYTDDLINPDVDGDDVLDPGFPQIRTVATSATLDATGTILTITPPATGFPKNETITVGPVTAVVNGLTTTFEQEIYVEDDTPTGLAQTTVVTADNYGLPYNSYSSPGPSVFLEFPEYVTGTYRVVSYTTSSGTVTVDWPAVQIGPSIYGGSNQPQSEMVYTDGSVAPACTKCGSGNGASFRVSVTLVPPQAYYCCSVPTLADGDKLRVDLDVRDAVGSRLSKDVEVIVQ